MVAPGQFANKIDELLGKDDKTRKILTIAVVAIIIATIAGVLIFVPMNPTDNYETGVATLQDLLSSKSERTPITPNALVVSDSSPNYAMIGTPIAMYYEEGSSEPKMCPLLVMNSNDPSYAVTRFLNLYRNPDVVTIGDVSLNSPSILFRSNQTFSQIGPKAVSLATAKGFWASSDGVIIVEMQKKKSIVGYEEAVVAVAMASYLNIPVIFTDVVDTQVASVLKSLHVKYSIVCGDDDFKGYGKTMKFKTVEEIQDVSIALVRQRLGGNVTYVTMANPLDTKPYAVVSQVVFPFEGEATHSDAAAYPGAAPSVSAENPIHYFEIPADYEYANLVVDFKFDISQERLGDFSGARLYCYIGVDSDEDGVISEEAGTSDVLEFFGGTPGYKNIPDRNPADWFATNEYAVFHTELPFYKKQGKHAIQLLARLPSDWGNSYLVAEEGDYTSTYSGTITIQKLSDPTYRLMPNLSSMAPYLTAYHKGVVLAKPEYTLYNPGYVGCKSCGDPASNPSSIGNANQHVATVKADLNRLLGRLAGMPAETRDDWLGLADKYQSDLNAGNPTYLGIIADTNMIPMYYYNSTGQGDATEGFGIPSDIIYSSVDADPDNAPMDIGDKEPDFELPVGRIDGWDAQDVSALIARTFFYKEIIDNMRGGRNGIDLAEWKNSGYTTIGSEPPVGAAETAAYKINAAFQQAGFTVKQDRLWKQDECRRQRAGPYYESANFIFFCAHGFYYWYVPPAVEGSYGPIPPISAGGAFDVAHVKNMAFGPSVLWASSCVTGRIDGLQPYNCISQAFLHAGLACYIGATRSSWGVIFPNPDATSGEKLGDLMALHFWAHLTGYIYNKSGGLTGVTPADTSVGVAMTLARNAFVASQGTDGGGSNDDTFEEFIIHGDPAFNPYEPNHG